MYFCPSTVATSLPHDEELHGLLTERVMLPAKQRAIDSPPSQEQAVTWSVQEGKAISAAIKRRIDIFT